MGGRSKKGEESIQHPGNKVYVQNFFKQLIVIVNNC